MAKIAKVSELITVGESNKVHIESDVFYSAKDRFYVPIPDQYREQFEAAYDTLVPLGACRIYKGKYSQGSYKCAAGGCSTQEEAITKFREVMKATVAIGLKERRVIIVYIDKSQSHYGGQKVNKEHEHIGIKMGLCYAIEVTGGNKACYFTERTYNPGFGDPERVIRDEVHSPGNAILEDTEMNRDFLERTYTALAALTKKMEDLGSSSEALQKFIINGNLLLNKPF